MQQTVLRRALARFMLLSTLHDIEAWRDNEGASVEAAPVSEPCGISIARGPRSSCKTIVYDMKFIEMCVHAPP